MAYECQLESGQTVMIENQGTQTIVTISSRGSGQQQQSSSSFSTGSWTSPPQMYRHSGGAVLKITTSSGEHCIQIQGSSLNWISDSPGLENSQQMQVEQVASSATTSMPPMKPIEPMKPMKMGDMEMRLNPMEMRIGNMGMQMGSSSSSTRRFCSQCGNSVKADDRFCSSCGHRLS